MQYILAIIVIEILMRVGVFSNKIIFFLTSKKTKKYSEY